MVQKKDKEIYVEKDNSAISAFSCTPLRKNRIPRRMKQVGGSLPGTNSVPFRRRKRGSDTSNPIILVVETKLLAIISRMAIEIQERHAIVKGSPLVQICRGSKGAAPPCGVRPVLTCSFGRKDHSRWAMKVKKTVVWR
ncbi:hypothetical protein IEQ34_011111 [Dendrobium chrysotoxum]|uniref:Ribosomal protein S12 n=1 Tax=Dendrobium chrysotoxum TaxID=161865 RepID=A0AAV7GXI7_DENCH|nr:hypothetical protein IEQ34_011111 [Dendrobium chrysotoxum]